MTGLTLYDEFAGFGGSSQGAAAVPGVELVLAANHSKIAVDVHALNFPTADHHLGDVTKIDLTRFPRADLFWASPACPAFSNARGQKQYFDRATEQTEQALFEVEESPEERARRLDLVKRRALMDEVPRYLQAMALRGKPVLAGVVENVVQVAKWDRLAAWVRAIETADPAGYTVWILSLNAMHAQPVATRRAPQSRPRFFAAYLHNSIGRRPDWDKWLRPDAWCPTCEEWVQAVQVWKKPGHRFGRAIGAYGIRTGQYVYRCPRIHGAWKGGRRPGLVEPAVLPAAVAIDWTLPPGPRIGDRVDAKGRPDPLEPATMDRIAAGLRRHAGGLLAPSGGTWRDTATPLAAPMPARSTRDTDALSLPSGPAALLVPATARDLTAYPTTRPFRTQTARHDVAVVTAPFLASLRGGGSKEATRAVTEPLWTFSAQGTHHALITPPTTATAGPPVAGGAMVMRNNSSTGDGAEMSTPIDEPLHTVTTRGHQSLITWDTPASEPDDQPAGEGALLVPYYGNGNSRPVTEPIGTLTTRDRYALLSAHGSTAAPGQVAVEDCTFRMLAPLEIAAGMAFAPDYRVTGSNRDRVAGYGNAVCPPCAEVIMSALVEVITGQDLPQ